MTKFGAQRRQENWVLPNNNWAYHRFRRAVPRDLFRSLLYRLAKNIFAENLRFHGKGLRIR